MSYGVRALGVHSVHEFSNIAVRIRNALSTSKYIIRTTLQLNSSEIEHMQMQLYCNIHCNRLEHNNIVCSCIQFYIIEYENGKNDLINDVLHSRPYKPKPKCHFDFRFR